MPTPQPTAAYRATIEKFEAPGIPIWRFTASSEESPSVIVLHGLTSRKERHLELCLQLAEAGFPTWAFDLRSHGDRRDADSATLRGSRKVPEFIPAFVRCASGSAEDVALVADFLGLDRYGIIGHSLGGYVALQAALRDPRAEVMVNISGSIDAAGSLPNGPTLYDIPTHAGDLCPRPVLLLHGTSDDEVPLAGAQKFHAAFTQAYGPNTEHTRLITYPSVGHELLSEMRTAAVEWMQRYLVDD